MPIDSILIAIFVFAMVLAYIFILRKLKPELAPLKNITKQNRSKTNARNSKEKKKNSVKKTETRADSPLSSEPLCLHEFGYLGTLPKNSKIPDECLGCPRIVKCLATGRSTN